MEIRALYQSLSNQLLQTELNQILNREGSQTLARILSSSALSGEQLRNLIQQTPELKQALAPLLAKQQEASPAPATFVTRLQIPRLSQAIVAFLNEDPRDAKTLLITRDQGLKYQFIAASTQANTKSLVNAENPQIKQGNSDALLQASKQILRQWIGSENPQRNLTDSSLQQTKELLNNFRQSAALLPTNDNKRELLLRTETLVREWVQRVSERPNPIAHKPERSAALIQHIANLPKPEVLQRALDIIRPAPSATLNNSGALNLNSPLNPPAPGLSTNAPTNSNAQVSAESEIEFLIRAIESLSPITANAALAAKPLRAETLLDQIISILFLPKTTKQAEANKSQTPPKAFEQALVQLLGKELAKLAQNKLAFNQETINPSQQYEINFRFPGFEIPIALHLWEHKDNKSDEADKKKREKVKRWRLLLEWTMQEAGPMSAQIEYGEEQALKASLWAEQPSLRQQMQNRLSELKHSLERCGIDTAQLDCTEHAHRAPKLQMSLVDVRT